MRIITIFILVLFLFSNSSTYAEKDVSNDDISVWMQDAAINIMMFDYNDYSKKKDENLKYFTPQGHNAFYEAMRLAKIDEHVIGNSATVTAVVGCFPTVSFSKNSDFLLWETIFPIDIHYSYKSHYSPTQQYVNVYATVKLNKNLKNDKGLKIDRWIAFPSNKKLACNSPEQEKEFEKVKMLVKELDVLKLDTLKREETK